MENVLVKMAAGGSDIVRSFLLILPRIPDNFHGCTLDDIETDACAAAKKDFSSSDESYVVEDGVLNSPSNSNESSDSAIGSLDSGPEESDPRKKYVDRYDSNESSERWEGNSVFLYLKKCYSSSIIENLWRDNQDYIIEDSGGSRIAC